MEGTLWAQGMTSSLLAMADRGAKKDWWRFWRINSETEIPDSQRKRRSLWRKLPSSCDYLFKRYQTRPLDRMALAAMLMPSMGFFSMPSIGGSNLKFWQGITEWGCHYSRKHMRKPARPSPDSCSGRGNDVIQALEVKGRWDQTTRIKKQLNSKSKVSNRSEQSRTRSHIQEGSHGVFLDGRGVERHFLWWNYFTWSVG